MRYLPKKQLLSLGVRAGRSTELTLERGADVNARSPASNNMTPLHVAIWLGRKEYHPKPMPEPLQEYGVAHLLPIYPGFCWNTA